MPAFTHWGMAALLAALLVVSPAAATSGPEWLRTIKNAAGELCCSPRDCSQVSARTIHYDPAGAAYIVEWRGVFHPIPERELLPGRHGEWWVCERPDGTIRCLLGPKRGS